jgi:hypothetical protein
MGYPLGGHIHFGVKSHQLHPLLGAQYLSQYLGAIGLLVEKNSEAKQRRGGDYGGFDDYREQDHGFEYRTLSSWLTSPYVASAFMCLAKTVMLKF